MTIHAGQLGLFLLATALLCAFVSFKLAKRKTTKPFASAAIGFFAGLIPVVAIIYILVLATKKDLDTEH